MKKLLTLAVALVALAVFPGLSVAQQKAEERSRPTGVEMNQPAPGERMKAGGRYCSNCYVCKCNTGSAGCLCDSIVMNMDNTTKTLSVKRKDGAIITLDASKLTAPPKVGQTVHVQYADVGGKPVVQSVAVMLQR